MRASVFSAFAGRFISLRIRGLACWNGTSRYGRTLPSRHQRDDVVDVRIG
jgi:hypothetical protein